MKISNTSCSDVLWVMSPSFDDNTITLKTSNVWPGNHSSQCLFAAKEPKALQISSQCSCELEQLYVHSEEVMVISAWIGSNPFFIIIILGSGNMWNTNNLMKSYQYLFLLFHQFSHLHMILCVNPFFICAVNDIQDEALGNSLNAGVKIPVGLQQSFLHTLWLSVCLFLCVLEFQSWHIVYCI